MGQEMLLISINSMHQCSKYQLRFQNSIDRPTWCLKLFLAFLFRTAACCMAVANGDCAVRPWKLALQLGKTTRLFCSLYLRQSHAAQVNEGFFSLTTFVEREPWTKANIICTRYSDELPHSLHVSRAIALLLYYGAAVCSSL